VTKAGCKELTYAVYDWIARIPHQEA